MFDPLSPSAAVKKAIVEAGWTLHLLIKPLTPLRSLEKRMPLETIAADVIGVAKAAI